jgi:tetratricopeptide (TPR) repeat protein
MLEETIAERTKDDRFEQLLAELLLAEERGEQPDLARLLQSAPDLETALREFLQLRREFDQLASGLVLNRKNAPALPALEPGSRFAGYEIVRELGRGGMGIVYHARQLAAGLLLLALVGGIVGTSWGMVKAEQRRTEAVRARDRARDALDAMTSNFTGDSLSTEQAEAAFCQARDGYQRLVADFPFVAEYRKLLALSRTALGTIDAALGDHEAAETEYRQALALHEQLTGTFPEVADYRHWMAGCHGSLALHFVDMERPGQVAEAVTEAEELVKLSNWNAGLWYDFACTYARAAGLNPDKKREHADQAMVLPARAVQAGYHNAAHMHQDTDLSVLRERDDFKRLIKSLEKPVAAHPGKAP